MERSAKIYVAGHSGLVGSAIVKRLRQLGYTNLVLRTHRQLDLTDALATREFFSAERPQYVFLGAARVGGIVANSSFPADFILENLLIQTHVIRESLRTDVERFLFLGSSCIYPKLAPQPLKEDSLLSGPLESTNRPYAVAKIAGIEMCWAFNRQYQTRFLAAMPTNLYGPGDNYDPTNSHLVPGLIRRIHQARLDDDREVTVWGTGTPRRELLYSEDAADACVFLMNLPDDRFTDLSGSPDQPPLINVGFGADMSVKEIAESVADVVGFDGRLIFDPSKPDGTPRKLMDSTRLNSLGWHPQMSFHDGLRMAFQDFLSHHDQEKGTLSEAPTI